MVLTVILIISVIVLTIVIALEAIEYRRLRNLNNNLEGVISVFTASHNSLVASVEKLSEAYETAVTEHSEISKTLVEFGSIIEIHNRALQLNPNLISSLKDETKIP